MLNPICCWNKKRCFFHVFGQGKKKTEYTLAVEKKMNKNDYFSNMWNRHLFMLWGHSLLGWTSVCHWVWPGVQLHNLHPWCILDANLHPEAHKRTGLQFYWMRVKMLKSYQNSEEVQVFCCTRVVSTLILELGVSVQCVQILLTKL